MVRCDWLFRTPLTTNAEQRRRWEFYNKKLAALRFPTRKTLGEVHANCPELYSFTPQRWPRVAGESWHFDSFAQAKFSCLVSQVFFPQIHEAASWTLHGNALHRSVFFVLFGIFLCIFHTWASPNKFTGSCNVNTKTFLLLFGISRKICMKSFQHLKCRFYFVCF